MQMVLFFAFRIFVCMFTKFNTSLDWNSHPSGLWKGFRFISLILLWKSDTFSGQSVSKQRETLRGLMEGTDRSVRPWWEGTQRSVTPTWRVEDHWPHGSPDPIATQFILIFHPSRISKNLFMKAELMKLCHFKAGLPELPLGYLDFCIASPAGLPSTDS